MQALLRSGWDYPVLIAAIFILVVVLFIIIGMDDDGNW